MKDTTITTIRLWKELQVPLGRDNLDLSEMQKFWQTKLVPLLHPKVSLKIIHPIDTVN